MQIRLSDTWRDRCVPQKSLTRSTRTTGSVACRIRALRRFVYVARSVVWSASTRSMRFEYSATTGWRRRDGPALAGLAGVGGGLELGSDGNEMVHALVGVRRALRRVGPWHVDDWVLTLTVTALPWSAKRRGVHFDSPAPIGRDVVHVIRQLLGGQEAEGCRANVGGRSAHRRLGGQGRGRDSRCRGCGSSLYRRPGRRRRIALVGRCGSSSWVVSTISIPQRIVAQIHGSPRSESRRTSLRGGPDETRGRLTVHGSGRASACRRATGRERR